MKRVKKVPKLMYEIRPSKALVGEVGIFAVRNINKGEIIGDIDSPEEVVLLSLSDFKKLDKITQNKIKSFCVLDDEEYVLPVDMNNMGSSWYFNHSCSPNVSYDKKGNFVADRNIKKDEELFIDYGWVLTDPRDSKMKCACGSAQCRHVISGRDWRNSEFKKNNINKMWPEMRKETKMNKK